MKTLLFAPETFNLAETTRMIETAKKCRHAANCVFMGYSTKFSAFIEEEGFSFFLLSPELSEADVTAIMQFDQMKTFKNPFTYRVLRQRVESELTLIDQIQPNGIIIGSTVSLFISARVRDIPLIYVKPYAYSRPHIESLNFMHKWPLPIRKIVRHTALHITWLPKSFRRLIKEYQLQDVFKYTIDFPDGDLNCITTPKLLTNNHQLSTGYVYTGPIFARLNREVPEEIIELANTGKMPLIYFSMGSSANQEIVLAILKHLAAMPFHVISPMKSYLTEKQQDELSETIHLYDWLPALEVNQLVDACIIHGGEGTVQTAYLAGKPFIGIGLQAEQDYNISCCAVYGNAIKLTRKELAGRAFFQQKINELIECPRYSEQAVKLKNELENSEGALCAAEQILAFCEINTGVSV
ncbi:hypothetical protein I6N96_04060 [Enterococcus sp. BWM-S5]|uniref:Glycosyl transferase n=1 Tax=Enterococcus larvae TaxID=2794352 RepID=A0ABS4CFN4_9ENTE|nr:nucleotide disphospho-sugar-binding domain-containing protein [Enterococcus larvae]MBP1045438.1 hypothetical protein [Enterococcus larvae]